jgi:hypothetical protein
MSKSLAQSFRWQSGIALLLSVGTSSSLFWPLGAQAQSRFADVQGLWATRCIDSLAQQRIINGYPDGNFRPNSPVSRAEFATMINAAFPTRNKMASNTSFRDVQQSYWAYAAIRSAAQGGFLSGYNDGMFRPTQYIPRQQVLVALANGLNYAVPNNTEGLLSRTYADAADISDYAQNAIAAATAKQVVVNYPNVRQLNPTVQITRAELATMLCQALKDSQEPSLISSSYIAGGNRVAGTFSLKSGTTIPVQYTEAERIVISPKETVDLTVTTAEDRVDASGQVVIPAGSKISGQLRPQSGGAQFVAQTVEIEGESYALSAKSAVIKRIKNTQDISVTSVVRNAAIGGVVAAGISGLAGDSRITPVKVLTGLAAGAAVETNQGRPVLSIVRDTFLGGAVAAGISGLVGDRKITPEKVISGAAAGATIGGVIDRPTLDKVVIIEPNTDLALKLDQRLVLAQQ